MMKFPIEARLCEKSERYQDWLKVFGGDVIPVLNAEPVKASLPIGVRDVYRLNVKLLEDVQYERLCNHLSQKFNAPFDEVKNTLDDIGLAILAEDVTVCIDPRFLI